MRCRRDCLIRPPGLQVPAPYIPVPLLTPCLSETHDATCTLLLCALGGFGGVEKTKSGAELSTDLFVYPGATGRARRKRATSQKVAKGFCQIWLLMLTPDFQVVRLVQDQTSILRSVRAGRGQLSFAVYYGCSQCLLGDEMLLH